MTVLTLLLTLLAVAGLGPAQDAPVQPVGDPAWKLSTFPNEAWPKGTVPEAEALVEQAKLKFRFESLDIPGAIELLKRAVAIDPKHPYAWWRLGGMDVLPGVRYEAGLAMMQLQVQVAPSATAYKHGGYLLFRGGYVEQALPFFREGTAKYPEDRELAALLGEALLALKKYDESATVLAAEVAKYLNSSRLQLNLARALLRSGHGDEAAPHFRSAVTFEPGPEMWIAVTSTLADAGSDLDYADALSRQAMATLEGTSAGWTSKDALDRNMRRTLSFLFLSWRVSASTAFKRGDLDTARTRLEAAMALSLSADDAQRLAQIDEARKDVEATTLDYGLASIWSRPPNAEINARLEALVPVAAERDALMRRAEQSRRALTGHPLARETRDQAQTGFAVVVDASGVVREAVLDPADVRPIGDVGALVKQLVGMDVGPTIPWNADARTLRRGRIDCAFQQPVCGVSMFTPQPVLEGQ